jgi:hypothetical protein
MNIPRDVLQLGPACVPDTEENHHKNYQLYGVYVRRKPGPDAECVAAATNGAALSVFHWTDLDDLPECWFLIPGRELRRIKKGLGTKGRFYATLLDDGRLQLEAGADKWIIDQPKPLAFPQHFEQLVPVEPSPEFNISSANLLSLIEAVADPKASRKDLDLVIRLASTKKSMMLAISRNNRYVFPHGIMLAGELKMNVPIHETALTGYLFEKAKERDAEQRKALGTELPPKAAETKPEKPAEPPPTKAPDPPPVQDEIPVVRPGKREGYIELVFKNKPSQEVRTILRTAGLTWAPVNKVWYGPREKLPKEYAHLMPQQDPVPASTGTPEPAVRQTIGTSTLAKRSPETEALIRLEADLRDLQVKLSA